MGLPGRRNGLRAWVVGGGVLLAALALSPITIGAPEPPRWTDRAQGLAVHGISNLQIRPKGGEIWYARAYGSKATPMGLVHSHDKGKTWQVARDGLDELASTRDAFEIALDPKDEKILYVVTRGKIYKSTDGAQSFQHVGSGTQTFSADRSQSKPWIAGLVVDPSNSKRLVAGTLTRGYDGGVFESKDGAKSWTQIAGTGDSKNLEESGLSHDAWPISLDKSSDKFLLVGGLTNSAWLSEDRGVHFKLTQPGGAGVHRAYQFTPMNNREVFLAESRGLWRSRDAGESWGKAPLLPGTCVSVEVDPGNRKQLYAVIEGEGLYRTSNLTSWEGPKHLELDPSQVYVHPSAPRTVFLLSLTTGLWVSTDRGETFTAVAGNLPEAVPAVTHAAVHPADATQWMCVTETGCVFSSQDAGGTWARAGLLGAPARALVGVPDQPGVWLAAGAGVRRSADGGATWTQVLASEDVEDRIVDLERLADGTYLALWERGARVHKSADAGVTWDAQGIERPTTSTGTWAADLAVDPRDPKHWLLATRTTAEGWVKDDRDGGAYETRDGGATWKLHDAGLKGEKGAHRDGWNRGVFVHVAQDGALLYAADGLGLFRALTNTDGTSSGPWAEVGLSGAPAQPQFNVLAAAKGEGDVQEVLVQVEGLTTRAMLRSSDGGKTWAAMPDPGVRLVSLAADPTLPGRYLSGDTVTDRGVLVFERPGATPPPGPTPAPAPGPTPPPPAPAARPAAGLRALSAGADGNVKLWDLHEGKCLPLALRHEGGALALALPKEANRLYTAGADKTIGTWNGATGETLGRLEGHGNAVGALALAPDGARLYAGDEDFLVFAWDLTTGKPAAKWEGHTAGVTGLAVAPDGRRVVSASRDKTVRVWDAGQAGPALLVVAHPVEVLAVALSSDGTRIYTGGRDASVRVFDAATGAPTATWATPHTAITGLAVTPDGKQLLVAGVGKGLLALSTEDGKVTATHAAGGQGVVSVALSADGAWIAGGGEDGLLRLWASGQAEPSWTSSKEHAGWIFAVGMSSAPASAPAPAPAPGPANPTPAPGPAMGEGAMDEPGMGEAPPAMGGP